MHTIPYLHLHISFPTSYFTSDNNGNKAEQKISQLSKKVPSPPQIISPKIHVVNIKQISSQSKICPNWFDKNEKRIGNRVTYHLMSQPKRKCCIMGTFSKTSTLYILSNPLFTLFQLGTPLISSNSGECSANRPFFTFFTNAMLERYRYSLEKFSSISSL